MPDPTYSDLPTIAGGDAGGPCIGNAHRGTPVLASKAWRVKVKVSGTNTTPPLYTAAP